MGDRQGPGGGGGQGRGHWQWLGPGLGVGALAGAGGALPIFILSIWGFSLCLSFPIFLPKGVEKERPGAWRPAFLWDSSSDRIRCRRYLQWSLRSYLPP